MWKGFKQIMSNRDRHSQHFHAENNHDILQKMKSQLSPTKIIFSLDDVFDTNVEFLEDLHIDTNTYNI